MPARMKQAPLAKIAMLKGRILNAIAIENKIPNVLRIFEAALALSFVNLDLLVICDLQNNAQRGSWPCVWLVCLPRKFAQLRHAARTARRAP